MNCREFESRIETLARGTLADARERSAAARHGEECAACAARLADERSLSTGLRALASGMRHAEAPARVEASLLAAFRAKAAAADKAGAGANVVPLAAPRRWSWVRTAAAASFAAAAALAFFVLFRPDVPAPAPAQSAKGGVRPMIEPPPGALGVPAAATLAQTTSPDGEEPETLAPAPGFKPRIPRAPLAAARPRAANISYGAGGARAVAAQNAPAQEIATDFIQLAEAGPYSQAEEAHLVRVELPRSALANFGLPVNAETAGGRVKADVLLGQDGVARAIRFVR